MEPTNLINRASGMEAALKELPLSSILRQMSILLDNIETKVDRFDDIENRLSGKPFAPSTPSPPLTPPPTVKAALSFLEGRLYTLDERLANITASLSATIGDLNANA